MVDKISQKDAKERIQKLIDKYNKLSSADKTKFNEDRTKQVFIRPLFEALGWDFEEDVYPEEQASTGRVDYSFRSNSVVKFFLEAKKLSVDLDDIKWAEQATNYGWHKNVIWTVLCDFEGLKVFNCEVKEKNPLKSQFFSIHYDQYVNRFDQLWLLSKESCEDNLLDKEAEKWGKKLKKIPVDRQLLNDLTKFRELLSKEVLKHNKSINLDELDEVIQRLIDRLIFIRTCEDRRLVDQQLLPVIRENKNKKIITKLREVFKNFDNWYDSRLFSNHLVDQIEIGDNVLENIISGLFKTKDGSVSYDFGIIDADVLGNIYEQYLGHILKKTEKRTKLSEGKTHRKEQGIYYTPTYIVNYIVENTIGEIVKNKKFDINKIKVLDPACGSGSFLIKAYDYLCNLRKKKEKSKFFQTKLDTDSEAITFSKKLEILQNNIFGVDLDAKAVEIAQLNLLLKAAEKKHRLPTLQENIKVGNSLIDDPAVAGDKAFKWAAEFKDIMSNGGFDVIIGNPPYVRPHNLDEKTKRFLWKNSAVIKAKGDLYAAFIEKGIQLMKEKGILSFIVPHTWLSLESFSDLRDYILNTCKIKSVIICPRKVFQDAEVETLIFVFEKCSNETFRKNNLIQIFQIEDNKNIIFKGKRSQKLYYFDRIFDISTGESNKIVSKLDKIDSKLKAYTNFFYGLKTADDQKFLTTDPKNSSDYKKILRRRDFGRYKTLFRGEYVYYKPELMIKNRSTARPGEPKRFEEDKIIIMDIAKKLVCTYDKEKYYVKDALILKAKNKNISLKYLVALINSNLLNYYYTQKYKVLSVAKNAFLELPILIQEKQFSKFDRLVDEILILNKRLNELGGKLTDERLKLTKEIQKVDDNINAAVYKLYNITDKEKKIIEDSFK